MRAPFDQYVSRSPTTTSPGIWHFDYKCWTTSYALRRVPSGSGPYTWTTDGRPELVISVLVSTSGSFGPGGNSTSCGCQIPLIQPSSIYSGENTVAYRVGSTDSIDCFYLWNTGNAWGYDLVPDGQSPLDVRQPVQVPTFCSGSYRITGTVWGPGDVSHGTFVIGNPLP